MPNATVTDEEFERIWHQLKSPARVAKQLGISERAVYSRRNRLGRNGPPLISVKHHYQNIEPRKHPARHHVNVPNGKVLVASDCHFWPGVRTTAFKGFLHLIEKMRPKVVIVNGDVFDGASISRFPRIGWDSKPMVTDELRACKDRLGEIEEAAGDAKMIWPLGNHDARYETFLAANAPQYEGVPGFTLRDHFPKWTPCWATWINDGEAVIKHRFKNGIHATHNNVIWSGKTMVTGHLHSLKVTPFSDYNIRPRWGVDCGTLAEPGGPQFEDYVETNPTNWRSGFAVLTFKDGELLWPELAFARHDGCIEFRGDVIDVTGV